MHQPYLVLGLDPGIASCGFCLIDTANHQILEMGAHLFDDPREDKTLKSLAAKRRGYRSVRRNTLRTKNRQKHCLSLLIEHGLLPVDSDKQALQAKKGDKPILKLRASGLDRILKDREFAQVLYSLSAHRGYIPHGEGSSEDNGADDDDGKVLKAIAANEEAMASGGWRTVGEMLYESGSSRNKAGQYDKCVLNGQIVDEVHALFSAQRRLGNEKASEVLEAAYLECLEWEKQTADYDERVYSRVGKCSYFPEETRAANADPSSELCRAYERFGHLVIVRADGTEESLPAERRDEYLRILFSPAPTSRKETGKVTYALIRKDLDLSAKDYFKGIDPAEEKDKEPFAPKAWRLMRSKGLPTELLLRMMEDRSLGNAICEALTYASTKESLVGKLTECALSDDEIERICSLPFNGKVFKGYGSRSLKALDILIDAFNSEEVLTLIDAERVSGLLGKRLSKPANKSGLLPVYDVYDPDCTNPVVLRALGRMRKIVNAIIRIYGIPDRVHIELGRELKQSLRERKLISKRQKKNEADNARWAATIAEIRGITPDEVSKRDILKCLLREEQREKDVYTGDAIDLERMVIDDTYTQIDHVIPYSRSCDNNRNNRVLVLSSSNQRKGERTPFEWMTSGEAEAPDWDAFEARVLANVELSRKRAYLLKKKYGPDEQNKFIARNLNDTRYMSRAVKDYIEKSLAFPDDGKQHVVAVAGGATASLRHAWGLNMGVGNKKDRTDNRHHAVDAAVIAACSQGTVQAVAVARSKGYKQFKEQRDSRLADTQPWPTFAEDVLRRWESVVPTRMSNHGATGQAFEDTAYRYEGQAADSKKMMILYAKGKTVKKGNAQIDKAGNARIVGGMAFLRLWCDSEAKRGKGKWYADPVYYADMPAIMDGTYVPRAAKAHVARVAWEAIPESALRSQPITVFRGDVLSVDGRLARYSGFHISNCSLEYEDLLLGEPDSGMLTLGRWDNSTSVRVIQEDCLGHCYSDIRAEE